VATGVAWWRPLRLVMACVAGSDRNISVSAWQRHVRSGVTRGINIKRALRNMLRGALAGGRDGKLEWRRRKTGRRSPYMVACASRIITPAHLLRIRTFYARHIWANSVAAASCGSAGISISGNGVNDNQA